MDIEVLSISDMTPEVSLISFTQLLEEVTLILTRFLLSCSSSM